jgi:hypothetical protein
MIGKREVLRLIAQRNEEGRRTSYRNLVDEFWLTDEAACEHLKRLWQQRLIEPTEAHETEHALVPGESIRELRFVPSAKGKKRLRFWKREEKREAGEGWWW